MDESNLKWAKRKSMVIGLVVGLLAGPLISGMMGWQVTSAFLQQSVHKAVIAQQAAFCELRARAAVKNTEKMEYQARWDVAQKWAIMPGQTEADSDVVSACTNSLG